MDGGPWKARERGTTMTNKCLDCEKPSVGRLWVDGTPESVTPSWKGCGAYCDQHGAIRLAKQRRLDVLALMPMGRWSFGA